MNIPCVISRQIADHCNEPEESECPMCGSTMTETSYPRNWEGAYLKCDNQDCEHEIHPPEPDFDDY
tara:strand:+ start:17661 stop:17858 length:198 start_codon:yes stop_codon:yes gene_type:complete